MAGSKRKKMAKGDVVFNAVIYTFFALLYNRHTPELTTLQYELFKLNLVLRHNVNDVKGSFSGPPRSVKCAAAFLAMLPLFIAYPFLQKYFIDGLKVGTIKD